MLFREFQRLHTLFGHVIDHFVHQFNVRFVVDGAFNRNLLPEFRLAHVLMTSHARPRPQEIVKLLLVEGS